MPAPAFYGSIFAGRGGSVPPTTDPLWDDVLSLLRFNGTSGDQVFDDDKGLTWVPNGGTTRLLNTTAIFGPTSLFVGGAVGPLTHNGIATADTAGDFQTGAGALSLEWWQYWTSLTDFQNAYDYGGTATGGLLVETGSADGKYLVYLSGSVVCAETDASPTLNTWIQYSLVYDPATQLFTIARNNVITGTSAPLTPAIGIPGASPTWGAYASGANATSSYLAQCRITAAVRDQLTPQTASWPTTGP
jgi:hypothetical protein